MIRPNKLFSVGIGIVLASSMALTGCTNSSSSKVDVSSNGKIEISFAVMKSKVDTDNKVQQKIVDLYNRAQNKVKLDLQLIDVGNSSDAARTWTTTQLIGGSAPDLLQTRYIWSHEDYGKGLVQPLNDYLQKPNPYNDNKKWKDTFAPAIMQSMTVPATDKIAGIPTYALSVRLFYNKELFKKAGITTIPTNWDDFLAMQAALKAKGITPMAIGLQNGGDSYNWMVRYFSDQVSESLLPQLDLNHDGMIESNEIVRGVEKGIIDFSKAPWKSVFPLIKDWTQYWPKGFTGLTGDNAKEMFLGGQAAMFLSTPSLARDLKGVIDYGVMRVPYLTKKDHPDAQEKFYEVAAGNPDGVFAVPAKEPKEKVDAAMDFMMYMTSPKIQQIIAEELYNVPILKDAQFPDNIKEFLLVNEPFKMNLFGPAFSRDLYDALTQYGQQYYGDKISLDEYISYLNSAAKKTAEDLQKTQGWSDANEYGTKK